MNNFHKNFDFFKLEFVNNRADGADIDNLRVVLTISMLLGERSFSKLKLTRKEMPLIGDTHDMALSQMAVNC